MIRRLTEVQVVKPGPTPGSLSVCDSGLDVSSVVLVVPNLHVSTLIGRLCADVSLTTGERHTMVGTVNEFRIRSKAESAAAVEVN